jgi:hypothetical protein
MKKLIFLLISVFCFLQCKKKDAVEIVDIKKSVDLNIERFDLEFLNIDQQKLTLLKKKYPKFLPETEEFTNEFWINKSKEPAFIDLNNEVRKKFNNIKKLENDLEMLVSRIKYYFPEEKTPSVYTIVNEIANEPKALYTEEEEIINKIKIYAEYFKIHKQSKIRGINIEIL